MMNRLSNRLHTLKTRLWLSTLVGNWRMDKDDHWGYAKNARRDTAILMKKSDTKCVIHAMMSTLMTLIMLSLMILRTPNMIEYEKAHDQRVTYLSIILGNVTAFTLIYDTTDYYWCNYVIQLKWNYLKVSALGIDAIWLS